MLKVSIVNVVINTITASKKNWFDMLMVKIKKGMGILRSLLTGARNLSSTEFLSTSLHLSGT